MRSTILTILLPILALTTITAPSFAAEVPPDGAPLTLHGALNAADERNLTLEGVRFELDRSDAQLSRAVGLVLPVASAGATYRRADHEDTVDMTSALTATLEESLEGLPFELDTSSESEPMVVSRRDDLSGSLTVAMSVIDVEAWTSIRAAKVGTELTGASVEDTRQELLLGVAQAWYAARMTGTLVELAEAQVTSAEHHLEVALARVEAGTGLRIDQVRAEADLAQARQDLLDATLAWETSRDTLGVITGLGGLPIPTAAPVLAAPVGTDDELVELALPRRTDLVRAGAGVDVARAQIHATRARFAPSVDLAFQASYQFTEPGDMGSTDPSRWYLVASLDIPIYDHFRYVELRERKAGLRQAEVQLEDARWQAAAEVRGARRDRDTAVAAVDIAGQQAELAAEALQLTLDAYEAGAGSSLEVTDARRNTATAEVNVATTRLEADLALLSLLRATGQDMLGVAVR